MEQNVRSPQCWGTEGWLHPRECQDVLQDQGLGKDGWIPALAGEGSWGQDW